MRKRKRTSVATTSPAEGRWLLLIHQIPPRPTYLRVKIWRRLQRLGAIAIKNSVYALPRSEGALEDLQWVRRELVAGGGEASICEAKFVDGLADDEVIALFNAARDEDYAAITSELEALAAARKKGGKAKRAETAGAQAGDLVRLGKRVTEVQAIDFFAAPGRDAAATLLAALEAHEAPGDQDHAATREPVRKRTWVTRIGIHVDRMASGWLIRRFIDPEATFKYVPAKGYRPEKGELRFDMFEAEYTHEGDACTFEVLIARFGLGKDAALGPIAQIIHDLDLKDERHGRPETAGVKQLLDGIALAHRDDDARLARASALFDDLYEVFRRGS
jgi:hypothetical protein